MMNCASWVCTALICWVVLVLQLSGGISELICPKVADLHTSVLLSCIVLEPTDIFYIQPGGTLTAATCISGKCHSILTKRFNGTVVNMTHSYLEIKQVQLLDEGNWTCRDTNRINVTSNCSLILRKTPTCCIASYDNTNNLVIGDEVTLSIHIKDYYCSRPTDFLIQTGYVLENVVKEEKPDAITSNMYNTTFNLSKSHIGSLEMLYTCNGISQSINCDGIQRLLEKPPACNITSDKDTPDYDVSENIIIVVHVEIYNCSQNLGYKLQTGQRMEKLVRTETRMSKNMNEFSSTFTLTESHFGPVYLHLFCNNVSRSVSCEGVRALNKNIITTDDTGINTALIGTTAAAVVIIIVTVIMVCVVKRCCKHHHDVYTNRG